VTEVAGGERSGLATPEVQAIQARTLRVLVGTQAFGGLGMTVGIAVASVLARDLSGSEALAGMAQTLQVLGAAVAAYVLARISGMRGRRAGMVAGYLTGTVGAAACVLAGVVGSFVLLLAGALLLGATSATNYQARYVAADLALPHRRGRSLATVMWATTFGAVLGPNLVGPAGRVAERLGLPALTGPFLLSVVISGLAAMVVLVLLRPDPLHVARQVAGRAAQEPHVPGGWRRAMAVARAHRPVAAAMTAVSAAHAVMVAVMVMTPLHMDHGGAELEVIGFVISIHVLGMFFFSPVMGWIADRFGRAALLLGGGLTLLVACLLSGLSPAGAATLIGGGLFLLGLGWSACTVGASTLLTEATPIDDRTQVQGTTDLLMNVAAAAAGVLGGVVVDLFGFAALNVFSAVLALGVLWAAWVARHVRSPGDTPSAAT
jgi:MFS family permease